MKRRAAAILTACIVTVTAAPVGLIPAYGAEAQLTAFAPDKEYAYDLNGEEISMPVYAIEGELCTSVRAFAAVMGYHAELNADMGVIEIQNDLSGNEEAELAVLLEMVKRPGTAKLSSNQLAYGGNAFEVPMYEVNGYTFLSFEAAAGFFGHKVIVDEEAGTVTFTNDPLRGMGEEERSHYEEYVKEHGIPLDLSKLDKLEGIGFDDYDVFFVGENHATKVNYDLQLYFIKYFNENYGIRHIIRETGYCEAMYENQVIQTGDESIARMILEGSRGSSTYNKEFYEFLIKLAEYNKTLPEDRKLILLGVDVQHHRPNGYSYIKSLLGQENAPDFAKDHLEKLNALTDEEKAPELLNDILATEGYKDYLGEDYKHLVLGIGSVLQSIEYYQAGDMEPREVSIRNNFKALKEEYGFEKTFGMLGGAHVNLTSYFGSTPNLAQFINNEYDATKGKLCTIVVDYSNSYYMDNQTGASAPITFGYSKTVGDIMAAAFEEEVILYPLEKEDSIFVEHGFTHGFSYYLSVKNSPATTIYKELQ